MLSVVPLEPLFVDRAGELEELDAILRSLVLGLRRHIALLGLRRIGKTMLLDEVRHRHVHSAIAYLALDEVVSSPEDFARAFVAEILRAAGAAMGRPLRVGPTDDALSEAASALHPDLETNISQISLLMRAGSSYGALLAEVMRFPAEVSQALDLPILIMLDEFQEIVRLKAFPKTDNLLGTVRAALDRRGKVAFVVAGSRVSAMRNLISDSESPLFTRFEQLYLHPFASDGTNELATRIWSDADLAYEPDATVRLHKLTGGWPFYAHAVAARSGQIARAASERITSDTIDIAFHQEVIGRVANIGQNCRYLLETALRTDAEGMRNTLEAVLRQVARWQPITRASVERRLIRHHAHTRIHNAINALVDADFLRETSGMLEMLDPVFALWLVVEPERRDPEAVLNSSKAMRRLLEWYEAQHSQDRQEMGVLFERRVENIVRQFKGQTVEGKLFGMDGQIMLPVVTGAGKVRVDDPQGHFGGAPDTFEVDIVTRGDRSEDYWGIEAKHRRGAITRPMVERFLKNARAVARAKHFSLQQLWMVAPRGIRPDALELAKTEGILVSGLRQLERLEGVLAASFSPTPPVAAED